MRSLVYEISTKLESRDEWSCNRRRAQSYTSGYTRYQLREQKQPHRKIFSIKDIIILHNLYWFLWVCTVKMIV